MYSTMPQLYEKNYLFPQPHPNCTLELKHAADLILVVDLYGHCKSFHVPECCCESCC